MKMDRKEADDTAHHDPI